MKTIDSNILRSFGVQFLQAYGASFENASVITDHLVDNDLKGVESQGAMRLFEYARFMVEGKVDGKASPVVQTLAPGAFLVKGNQGFGIVAMQRAVDQILSTFPNQSMAVAAVTDVGHTGRVGAYAEALANHNCFGCVYGGGGHKEHPSVAPFGGTKGVMSTNPVAFAMPGMEGIPLSADFATSSSAGGKLRLAQRKGVPLPAGQILDKHGNPSTDPADYFDGGVMLPSAGPKGSGMGMINELLCYGMLGAPVEFNWVLTAFRLELFCAIEDYQRRSGEFLQIVNNTPPASGFQSVSYPGQFEARCADRRRCAGISISDSTAAQLAEMAQAKNLDIPSCLL
ncbi:Ldh family oxidoreductase [Flintibacter muris]|uniref:Ldh family oxidoreductase n=1 Tax=Flintibacter muris TaxID=2941327 RepID=UPI00203ADC70|nr:Ldh family oxidoreductase [Flintibacter muris]